jgi:hypothetical protein
MGKFADSVRANSTKVLMKANRQCFQIAKELFTSVVELTPSPSNPGHYAHGWLSNQWYPESGSFSEELSGSKSPSGADSINRINALRGLEFFRKDGKLTLTNNLSYAYRAEVLGWPVSDGWSGQVGPYRMVALSIQAIATKYK